MSLPIILYWLRDDLRLADNLALNWADEHGSVLPLYILDTSPDNPHPLGSAAQSWLHHCLKDMAQSYKKLGAQLVLRRGEPLAVLKQIIAASHVTKVVFSQSFTPYVHEKDEQISQTLRAMGIETIAFNNALLFEPTQIKTKTGNAYRVFTPFYRACWRDNPPNAPLRAPKHLSAASKIASDKLNDWGLLSPKADWTKKLRAFWDISETGAQEHLHHFINHDLRNYREGREFPSEDATSFLSPYLHWGQISPRQIWYAVLHAQMRHEELTPQAEAYLRELVWREFSYHLLWHNPSMPKTPMRKSFKHFPWRKDKVALIAWQKGQTGYPIVDAGMRQLWQTGWMHNRARMIVASFLVKHLLITWQEGAAWFLDTLVDADLANNAANWQWVSGCGVDSSPFFRIFNPILQGQRFDPDGAYVRAYVPELANIDKRYIHTPWLAPHPPADYPSPIVDHAYARERALVALRNRGINE